MKNKVLGWSVAMIFALVVMGFGDMARTIEGSRWELAGTVLMLFVAVRMIALAQDIEKVKNDKLGPKP